MLEFKDTLKDNSYVPLSGAVNWGQEVKPADFAEEGFDLS
jgi:hypothetical protein